MFASLPLTNWHEGWQVAQALACQPAQKFQACAWARPCTCQPSFSTLRTAAAVKTRCQSHSCTGLQHHGIAQHSTQHPQHPQRTSTLSMPTMRLSRSGALTGWVKLTLRRPPFQSVHVVSCVLSTCAWNCRMHSPPSCTASKYSCQAGRRGEAC